jgi:hypothetical protein
MLVNSKMGGRRQQKNMKKLLPSLWQVEKKA